MAFHFDFGYLYTVGFMAENSGLVVCYHDNFLSNSVCSMDWNARFGHSQKRRIPKISTLVFAVFSKICRALSYAKIRIPIAFGYSFVKPICFRRSFNYYCLSAFDFIGSYFAFSVVLCLCK